MAPQGSDKSPPRRRKTARIGPVVQVRRLHRRDLNKVWEFLKRSFRDVNLETVEYQRPRSKKRFYETYEEEGVEQLLFIVEGEIVAYTECTYEIIGSDTWINPRYFEKRDMRPLFVEELAVHPDWHGRGVGSFVLEQIQHLAKVRGLTHLVLEVAENNTHAMLWYRKRGFRKLDAAVFMAFAVDVAPELLPPRALETKQEAGPDDSAILAIPVTPDGGEPASGERPATSGTNPEAKKSRNGAPAEKPASPPPRSRKKASRQRRPAAKNAGFGKRPAAAKPTTSRAAKSGPAAKWKPGKKAELGKFEPGKNAEPDKAELGKAELGKTELGKSELGPAEATRPLVIGRPAAPLAERPEAGPPEPSNGQRRVARADTVPPPSGPPLPPGRRTP